MACHQDSKKEASGRCIGETNVELGIDSKTDRLIPTFGAQTWTVNEDKTTSDVLLQRSQQNNAKPNDCGDDDFAERGKSRVPSPDIMGSHHSSAQSNFSNKARSSPSAPPASEGIRKDRIVGWLDTSFGGFPLTQDPGCDPSKQSRASRLSSLLDSVEEFSKSNGSNGSNVRFVGRYPRQVVVDEESPEPSNSEHSSRD